MGYGDDGRAVYLPIQFAELLNDLPFGKVTLTGLVNLWLKDDSPDKNKQRLAVVYTTLGEICRTVGLSPNGPNRMKVKRSLRVLNLTRIENAKFFNAIVQGKRGKTEIKARHEVLTTFLPHLEFLDVTVDGKKNDTTVIAYICAPLTSALKIDAPKARIPLAALKATYGNSKATREMQNVLFWLSAVTPERPGLPLHPRVDTLINDVMMPEGNRKDKNLKRLERILNTFQKTGFIAWWKLDGEYCVIMKKRDQDIALAQKKKALPRPDQKPT